VASRAASSAQPSSTAPSELSGFGLTVKLRQGPPNFWDAISPADVAMGVESEGDAAVDDEPFFACAPPPGRLDAATN